MVRDVLDLLFWLDLIDLLCLCLSGSFLLLASSRFGLKEWEWVFEWGLNGGAGRNGYIDMEGRYSSHGGKVKV